MKSHRGSLGGSAATAGREKARADGGIDEAEGAVGAAGVATGAVVEVADGTGPA